MSAPDAIAWMEAQVSRLAVRLAVGLPEEAWLRALAAGADQPPPPGTGPAARLRLGFGLSTFELDLLLLALLPEVDARFGDVFQALRSPAGRRPSVGIGVRVLLGDDAGWEGRWRLEGSLLWSTGLLLPGPAELPLVDRPLRPAAAILPALMGRAPGRLDDAVRIDLDPRDESVDRLLAARPSLAPPPDAGVVWVRGGAPEAVRALAFAHAAPRSPGVVATELADRRGLLHARIGESAHARGFTELRIACALLGTAGWASVDGAAVRLPALTPAPVLVQTRPEATVEVEPGVRMTRRDPPQASLLEQADLWAWALGRSGVTGPVDRLANQTRLDAEVLREVGERAAARALAEDRPADEADIRIALAEVRPPLVARLGEVSSPMVPWSRLILPTRSQGQLAEVLRRMEHRVTVQARWGIVGNERRGDGLVVLLHGESGTGKTLAAEALATALCLPLLRIDLSRVVSKYIGETEKNLAEVFDAAEGFGAVLLIDEADALFGKRTAVKDAHDRYANIETNYLLQRLEAFVGVAVLATNLLQNLDDAFVRRLHFVVHLPKPTASMQAEIWRSHLPRQLLAPDVDIASLSRFDLVGGDIRNAALTAAYGAAAAGTPITHSLLADAVREELLKRGRALPPR